MNNKMKGPTSKPKKQKPSPSGQIRKMGKSHVPNPLVTRSMLEKEKGTTLERTPNIEKPSPTIMIHFEIDVDCICCNITNILYLYNASKTKRRRLLKPFITQAMLA
jgi:hypothetical protein